MLIEDHYFPVRMGAITRSLIVHEEEPSHSDDEEAYGVPKEPFGQVVTGGLVRNDGYRILWDSMNTGADEPGQIDVQGIRPLPAFAARRQETGVEE